MVRMILKIEGLFIFFIGLIFYYVSNPFSTNWLLFILLILIPDLSMIGYFMNKRIGAIIYNLVHNLLLPILIVICGFISSNSLLLSIGFAFLAHVGIDRAFGYGLKYPTDFKDIHMQKA